MPSEEDVPPRLKAYIAEFDDHLSEEEFNSPRYAYRLLYTRKMANRRGQADKVFEFVDPTSEIAQEMDKQYWVVKEVERPKYLPKHVVAKMRQEGYARFNYQPHTQLWKAMDAKNPGRGFGVKVGDTWYWYEPWLDKVRKHCEMNAHLYAVTHQGSVS